MVWNLSVHVQYWGDSEASLQGVEGCIWTCSLGPGSGPGLYTAMKSGSKEWMLAACWAAAIGSHGPGDWGEGSAILGGTMSIMFYAHGFYVNKIPGGQQNQQANYGFTLGKIKIIEPKMIFK